MAGALRSIVLAWVMVGVALAGCIGFGGAEDACSDQHPYADRLVLDQQGLYDALGQAQEDAADSPSASSARHQQGVWEGARGAIETVHVDGRVHGSYDASPAQGVSFRVQDSALAGYGTLWLDRVDWRPDGTPEQQITYDAPTNSQTDHAFTMHFRTPNVTEEQAAGNVRTLYGTLFPQDPYDPLADRDFSEAWTGEYERTPEGPVHADALVSEVIEGGQLTFYQAPFEDLFLPHTLGTVHLEGEDAGPYQGEISLRLSHDVRAVALGNSPTLVLEATPADRGVVSNLGSAPLGAQDLRDEARERFAIDSLPDLNLDEARYEDGGRATGAAQGGCTPMAARGQPLTPANP